MAQTMCGRTGGSIALLLLLLCCWATPQKAEMLTNTDDATIFSPYYSGDSNPPFSWPAPIAQRCVALGASPRLSLTLQGVLKAMEAAKAYAANTSLLFDGYW